MISMQIPQRHLYLQKKVYADESGANPLKNGMFEFKLKATGDNAEQAPMPTGEKDENGYIHVVNVGTGITFGNMVLQRRMSVIHRGRMKLQK